VLHHVPSLSSRLLHLTTYGVPYSQVLSRLVEALALRAELNVDKITVMRDFEEMAILCRELLVYTQRDCKTDPGTPLDLTRNLQGEPVERVIESLREAKGRLPGFHEISIALVWSLLVRFIATCLIDNYEEAATILDKVIASHTPRECPTSYKLPSASTIVPSVLLTWMSRYANPDESEEAIRRLRIVLNTVPDDHPLRPRITIALAGFPPSIVMPDLGHWRSDQVLPNGSC
jgi:hypothetical protein